MTTTSEVHPMLRSKRPLIITRPGERLAGDAKNSVEIGADGIWVDGHGRYGKTFGFRMLVQTDAWRPYPLHMREYTYPKPTKSGEGYFFTSFLLQDGQTVPSSAMSNVLMMRLANLWRVEAARDTADVVCVGINEANRLTLDDFEHVVSIGNEMEKWGRVFFFFINQIDAGKNLRSGLDRRPPRHIAGRYFTTSHHFTGLLWDVPDADKDYQLISDVALACREFDEVLRWPAGSGITYTQYFASTAYAKGWRLGSQLDLIRTTINAIRAENGLGPVVDWPMITFERFVYFVLLRIAFEDPDFLELTPQQVREVMMRIGYLHHEPGYKGEPA